jgi:DNA modification methylase
VDIEFYCKDARESFLEPSSVDLFITHPPFIGRNIENYGGDPSLQIQNTENSENFCKSIIQYLKSMSDALKDSGAILLILPNTRSLFEIIKMIMDETGLTINRMLVWNFEQSSFVKAISGNEINPILYITKDRATRHDLSSLDSLVLPIDWELDTDVIRYAGKGFISDAIPSKLSDILVRTFSNEGDTIADLMAGTGTVAISSLKNNRKTIYNDVSADQVDLAKRRIYDTIESERKGQ